MVGIFTIEKMDKIVNINSVVEWSSTNKASEITMEFRKKIIGRTSPSHKLSCFDRNLCKKNNPRSKISNTNILVDVMKSIFFSPYGLSGMFSFESLL